jgi:hypothetical protein
MDRLYDMSYANQIQDMVRELNEMANEWEPVGTMIYDDDIGKYYQLVRRKTSQGDLPKPAHNSASLKCLCDTCENNTCDGMQPSTIKNISSIYTVHKCNGYITGTSGG